MIIIVSAPRSFGQLVVSESCAFHFGGAAPRRRSREGSAGSRVASGSEELSPPRIRTTPKASIADVHRNVSRVRKQLKMLPYNEDAFKIGLCSVPPKVGHF